MVTIFIPTYNSSACIGRTLDSVINQTYQDWEILCVDDSSNDDTSHILKEYSDKDKRIKWFSKPNEGSVPFSWKYVLPKISGEFTLYMSHDDLLLPDSVERLVGDQKLNNADCTIPIVRFFEKDISNPEKKYEEINSQYAKRAGTSISGLEAFNLMLDYTIPGFGLWRTSVIRDLGIPTTSFNSDEFAQRLWVKHCNTVAFSFAIFGYYQTEKSIVKGFKPYHIFSLDTNLRLFKEICDSIDIIPQDRMRILRYRFYFALLYLSRIFYHNQNDYDSSQQSEIIDLIEHSRKEYGILPIPKTIRELSAFLCSLTTSIFYMVVKNL